MSATLWLNTNRDETIELGGTLQLYEAFAEMARIAGDSYLRTWPALFSVCAQVESQDDAPEDWLTGMRGEAAQFLEKYSEQLSEDAVWVLEQLTRTSQL